jgi:hypothetical protein
MPWGRHKSKTFQDTVGQPAERAVKAICDFHSIVVRRDGAIAHVLNNSHSGAVKSAGWTENDTISLHGKARFIECEWDGRGEFPGFDNIKKSHCTDWTKAQQTAVESHYSKLASYLNGDDKHAKYFSSDHYLDVFAAKLSGSVSVYNGKITLDLSSLTALPDGVTFPAKCDYLDLSSLTAKQKANIRRK